MLCIYVEHKVESFNMLTLSSSSFMFLLFQGHKRNEYNLWAMSKISGKLDYVPNNDKILNKNLLINKYG